MCTYHIFFSLSSVRQLGCFHNLVIVDLVETFEKIEVQKVSKLNLKWGKTSCFPGRLERVIENRGRPPSKALAWVTLTTEFALQDDSCGNTWHGTVFRRGDFPRRDNAEHFVLMGYGQMALWAQRQLSLTPNYSRILRHLSWLFFSKDSFSLWLMFARELHWVGSSP